MDVPMHAGRILLASVLAGMAGSALGAEDGGTSLGSEWKPIDPARLDEMRGGFELPSGVVLSFGIERAVYVNGQLTADMAVRVSDLSRISAEEAREIAAFNEGIVVQIGEGNRFEPTRVPGGVVIQNTLNDQRIVTVTRLEVGSNALGTFQELNTSGALHDALISVAGNH